MDLRKEFEKDHPIPAKLTNLPGERHFSPEYVEWIEQRLQAGQHETIVIALEKRRKQFEETYAKESDKGNFMNADKAGFYEECYRNVIKDLKEEVQ